MMKQIDGYLKFANSSDGDTERAAFDSVLATALASDHVIPSVLTSNETSFKSNNATSKTIMFKLLYDHTNAGIAAFNTFWTTVTTELAKATVITGSQIRKCDNLHDSSKPIMNLVVSSK